MKKCLILIAALSFTSLSLADGNATAAQNGVDPTLVSCAKVTSIEARTCNLDFCFANMTGVLQCRKKLPAYIDNVLVKSSTVTFTNKGLTARFNHIDLKNYEKFKYFVVNTKA